MVPDRDSIVVLGTTVNERAPLPLPLVPAVIVIQASLLDADQLQTSGAVMLPVLLPPSDSKEALVGDRE